MIRPLRQRHRLMVIALSVVVPTAFAVGIATRRALPAQAASASALAGKSGGHTELWTRDDLWAQITIRTRLLRDPSGTGGVAVELLPRDQIVRPDVIVYWVPGEREVWKSLPDNAFLLGALDEFAQSSLYLPVDAARRPGVLVLYSLADHEIVAVSKLFSAK